MNARSGPSTHPITLRLRIGAVVALIALLGNLVITQRLATALGSHAVLGNHWNGLYQPFAWFGWGGFYSYAPGAFAEALISFMALLITCLLGFVVSVGLLGRSATHARGIHGTAHWAVREEIRRAGLMPMPGEAGAGVYVGAWCDKRGGPLHYLRHDGPEHVAAIAPTRSGKGVGLVVPTCLSWPASMVVADRKGELWNLTAGWRSTEAGNTVVRFNPSSPIFEGFSRFNPLTEVRIGTGSEVGDTQNIATMLADPKGKGLDTHWQLTSFAFLTGAILHECYKARAEGREATLADVLDAVTDPARDVSQYYEEMMANKHDATGLYDADGSHPIVAAEGRTMLQKPDDERGSVLSTAISYLSLYRDPIVRRHTSRSDFRIMDLMNSERPMTVYLTSRDEDADRMRPLFRLMLNQFVRVLLRPELEFVDGRQKPPHKHRMLLMLDEFPAFGKLEIFKESLAYIAGYGIKAYLIMQDIAQLWAAYGRDETITANCHVRCAYAPNKLETAEWLSKMTGTMTELKWQITESGKRFGLFADGHSRSASEVSRPLLTPDEAMRLRAPIKRGAEIVEAGDMLVFAAGHPVILGTQPLYFRDKEFLRRSKISAPAGRLDQVARVTPVTNLARVGGGKSMRERLFGSAA